MLQSLDRELLLKEAATTQLLLLWKGMARRSSVLWSQQGNQELSKLISYAGYTVY